ncbi:MAG: putative toxin-antitoxin system toxin component, PIN family [Thermoanaerobaculia bacterium]
MGAPELTRAVCDTNVVVSAILFREGRLDWLREAWRSRRLLPLVSRATAAELVRVLCYPEFELNADERRELLGDYLPMAEIVDVSERAKGLPPCRDPNDRAFLELAMAGGAELLITGDLHLLELDGDVPFSIVRPAEARSRLLV